MSQTNSPKLQLAFTARTDDKAGAEALEVTVKNDGGAAWADVLIIELQIPSNLVTEAVNKASQAAPKSRKPPNMSKLAGVVTVPAGWTAWAFNKGEEHVVVVRVFNSELSSQSGASVGTPTSLDANAAVTLRVPLKPEALGAQATITYGYQSDSGDVTRGDGKLELKPSHLPEFKPEVGLTVSHKNPTMIKNPTKITPVTEVTLSWSVKDGVAATLRGPLPAGKSEFELSPDADAKYKIAEGSLNVLAVGPATYILDAEVKNPAGGPNVQVIRTLTLDIYSADKYSNLLVRPHRVLPHGQVEIDWAVWGVQNAEISVGGRLFLDLELTEQNLFRTFQGTGTWALHATADKGSETVSLAFKNTPNVQGVTKATFDVITWEKIKRKPSYEGVPFGMAYAGETGTLALLTTDGLYTAGVGRDDKETKEPVFVKAQAEAKAWHRITAFDGGFVVLKQAADENLVVERYDAKGQRINSAVTLPGDFKTMLKEPLHGRFYNLVALGSRVYVVAGGIAPSGGEVRSACSVSFKSDTVRAEPALAGLRQYRLLGFDGAIYAYQRQSGRMLRFDRAADDTLEPPRRAASAVNEEGASMIKSGTLVPVGTVLAVLNPAALPSFKPFALLGLENVLRAAMSQMLKPAKEEKLPQDLVYNPQTNRWSLCGRGLEVEVGAVAVRGGASKRMWVLQPEGEMYTLAGAKEELFASDYVDRLHPLDLKPALDATREFTLANPTVVGLVPPDEAMRLAGLEGFSSDGAAELSTPLAPLPNEKRQTFKFSYDSANTTNVKLRYMVADPPGLRYFFEVTFTGAGLGNVTSVFKRLSTDGRIDEIPNTSQQYAAGERDIAVPIPRPLLLDMLGKTRLLLLNATTREIGLSPALGHGNIKESEPVDFSYKTPDFKVSMVGYENVGHLWVSFDFAMPLGIEVSSRREPQGKLIRISADDSTMLDASVGHLDMNAVRDFRYEAYDGRKYLNPYTSTAAHWCRVEMRKKFEFDGVRLGDAVSLKGVSALYLPMAKPEETSRPHVYRFSLKNGELSRLGRNPSHPTRGGVFSMPNAVALDSKEVYSSFAEPVVNRTMHDGSIPWSRTSADHYPEFVALAASAAARAVFALGTKKSGAYLAQPGRYFVVADRNPNDVFEIPFDQGRFGTAHGALAASPDGNWVAVCHKGGFLAVDITSRNVVPVDINNARDPAHIVFSHDGQWVYCAHATRTINMNPRRADHGTEITVTRARVGNWNERQTLALPDVKGDFHLTADTSQTNRSERPKEDVALSLAPSPDGRSLFVSAGKTIKKIALSDFKLQPWSATVELPCRLACVKEGWGEAWTLYALGSYYKGDGTKVEEFKTHLYAIPAPVN